MKMTYRHTDCDLYLFVFNSNYTECLFIIFFSAGNYTRTTGLTELKFLPNNSRPKNFIVYILYTIL